MKNQVAYECGTCMENCKEDEGCRYEYDVPEDNLPSLLSQWIDREIKRLTSPAQISELRLLQDVDPETKDKLIAYLENRIAMLDEQHRNRLVDREITMENLYRLIHNECRKLRQENCESARARIDESEKILNGAFTTKKDTYDYIKQRIEQLEEKHDDLVIERQNAKQPETVGAIAPISAEIITAEIKLIEYRMDILHDIKRSL